MTDVVTTVGEPIDTELTGEAVCPYCGHENPDSWELPGSDGQEGETTCGECERDFIYYRNVEVTYSTYRKEAS